MHKQHRYATVHADGITICCGGNAENFPRCPHCKGVTAVDPDQDGTPPSSYRVNSRVVEVQLDAHGVPRPYAAQKERK